MAIVPVLAFLSGFCIMSLELLGGRILSPYFGNSIFVWGSIITVFMLALSFGYLLGGRWSLSEPSLRRLSILFGAASVLIALVAMISDPVMQGIFSLRFDPRYGALSAAFVLFLPASIIMGMVSPYCVRLSVTSTNESGNTAGMLYFVSTLGSALGTIVTSFYLVAWLEVNQIIYAIALAMLAGSIIAFTRAPLAGEKEATV